MRRAALVLPILLAAGPAGATDWRQVLAHPDDVLGRAIELAPAFCGGGGPAGADPGLTQCSVGGGRLVVESRKLATTPRAREAMKSCGGLDVEEQSPFCRFTVRLVPRRSTLGDKREDGTRARLLGADELDLR